MTTAEPPAGVALTGVGLATVGRVARAVAALAAVAALVLAPPPAGAGQPAGVEVTADDLRRLAARAASDPGAAEALRRVERVDGRPVDLGRALDGAAGDELAARLAALGADGAGAPPAASAARDQAAQILEGRRFNPSPVPRPFRGVLRRLGEWARPLTRPVGRLWAEVADNALAAAALGTTVLVASALVAARLVGRRSAAGIGRPRPPGGPERHDDPEELERRAAAAEAAGDLRTALRLRFRAGLLRLDRAGAIVDRPALTTGELARHLSLPPLPELAAAFEEVAYGGRPATPDDVAAARAGWPRVVAGAGRR